MNIVSETKEYFLEIAKKNFNIDNYYLEKHVNEVEKWALKILEIKREANRDIVLLGVWLHDIGQLVGHKNIDHAINSEFEAKRFLSEKGVNMDIINRVAHCVRAHRCKDVQPSTLEARIVAACDSASHMTDIVYVDMASRGEIDSAKAKLERDYRDKSLIPEISKELDVLYLAWKKLLEVFPK